MQKNNYETFIIHHHIAAAPVRADRNLPMLDELFASLNGALEVTTAAVTGEIWAA